ncbi:MAG: carboxylating nicotinate-nucleotide diphosphorylase [Eubacteriales bacterium]|nr:carboxylating nicotinate-nucleotide diphosphorylase [Eubacteriales bacterium]
MIDQKQLFKTIETALAEDMGTGDITTMSTVPDDKTVSGSFIAKADGILCGVDIAAAVFSYIDSDVHFKNFFSDGDAVKYGDVIAAIKGRAFSVLTGERLALNFLQRLSGIATKTHEAVQKIEGFAVRIIDTRKTTPGLRIYEKYAVRTGGGYNHRFTLSDGVLIKDNHISAAGSITNAVRRARDYVPHTLKIEVETETLEQVKEALESGADIIMLDNMPAGMMKEAVQIINKKALVEASGNMDEKDLREVAATGVDFISIGALTNAVRPMDISLKFK